MKKTNNGKHTHENPREDSIETIALYRDIINAANILIWRTDAGGRFTFLNPAWEKSYGYKAEEMLGRNFSDFQVPEAAGYYINEFRNCLIGESVIGHEISFYSKKGSEINLVINLVPLHDDKGSVIGTQGVAYDITERNHADELLQYISAKDELTGLYNLHTFLSMTEQQMKAANRERKEMLVIYIGVDDMQSINDEYGFDTGDQILIDTADILSKTFREADVLSRTGGDEFVVSTLVSSRDTEGMIMKRLKENLKKYNAGKNGPPRLSLSFGTAFNDPENSVFINEVLSDAESKMYEYKKSKQR
ncbi:MAG: diguanylate cyclase [Nitrospirae bacterium]|nr:diguanylate cyclase [Nitrospirota bacterium]